METKRSDPVDSLGASEFGAWLFSVQPGDFGPKLMPIPAASRRNWRFYYKKRRGGSGKESLPEIGNNKSDFLFAKMVVPKQTV